MEYFAATELHISMASESLFTIGGFAVTNAVMTGLATTIIVVALFLYVARMVKAGRYNRFIGLVQWGFEGMLGQINSVIADKVLARKIAPLALTIFFFVLIGYWLSVLPGLDTIKVHGVPVLRSITADLNFTLGLALITMVTVQMYAIKHMGVFGNGGRYLRNPFKDPLGAFEGVLELIGEFSRGIALALRLFGNAFAGEVLLVIVAILTSYFAAVTLPFFMAFELFIGLIQAYVFFVLTLIFTSLAIESHGAHSPEHSSVDFADKAKQLE
ncbi:MAG TPA: F0F1 ATP synthase subunit A [Candidatus Saccharimonadales bacterium]|nr:F0F1 ATP synthase subunit A [Candidatus Saccharimonadales bacterium]